MRISIVGKLRPLIDGVHGPGEEGMPEQYIGEMVVSSVHKAAQLKLSQ